MPPDPDHQLTDAEIAHMAHAAEAAVRRSRLSRAALLRAGKIPLAATTVDELVWLLRTRMAAAPVVGQRGVLP